MSFIGQKSVEPHGDDRAKYKKDSSVWVLLKCTVHETGNPLLNKKIESGDAVAVVDCQTFAPEFIPVLKALERKRWMYMPFQNG